MLHEALSLARAQGDHESEQRFFEQVVRLFETNPDSVPLVSVERAILDPATGRDELQVLRDHLAFEVERPGADADVWRAYAVVCGKLGEDEMARAAIARVLAFEPSPEVRWSAVELDKRLERWRDVVSQLETLATEDEVKARVAKLQLVEAYARVGRLDDAVATANTLLDEDAAVAGELASNHWTVDALVAGAWALHDMGKSELARAAFEKVLELDPEHEAAATAVSLLYGTADDRREHARKADAKIADEGDPDAFFDKGTHRLAVGDAAGAIDLLRQAVTMMPEHEVAWSNLGVAALRLERWAEAAAAFEQAVRLGNEDPSTRLNLGTAWVRADRCEQGLAVLDRLASEHPELWQAQYWRWSCLSRTGREDEAAAALAAYQLGREGTTNDP